MTAVPQTAPAHPDPARTGPVRKGMADGWTVTRRYMTHWIREPEVVLIGLIVPIMLVLVFGYVFGSAMAVPGADSGARGYREFLMPGMFVMAMLYAIGSTGTAVATDLDKGVIDRFRSMPMSRSALLAGRSVADTLRAALEIVVLLSCAVAVGWRWHEGAGRLLAAVGLLLLLRLALTWVAIYLALLMPTPDSTSLVVYVLAFPLGALSSMFVPAALLPGWLGTTAGWNPLSATVTATRQLFGNPGTGGDAWVTQHAVLMAVLWPLLLLAVVVPLAVWRYRRLSR